MQFEYIEIKIHWQQMPVENGDDKAAMTVTSYQILYN
jgi:hypothetical protein